MLEPTLADLTATMRYKLMTTATNHPTITQPTQYIARTSDGHGRLRHKSAAHPTREAAAREVFGFDHKAKRCSTCLAWNGDETHSHIIWHSRRDLAPTLTLIVKGNRFQAAKAAADRNIPFAFVRETGHGETVGHVGAQHEAAVREWYHETTGQAFPGGRPIGDVLIWR